MFNSVTMLLFVLMVAGMCDCDDVVLPYLEYKQAMDTLENNIKQDVLSMASKVPMLDDKRRHYTEIHHVVFELADSQSHCLRFPYEEVYQRVVNESAPVAISDPAHVIQLTKKLIEKFYDKTQNIHELIRSRCSIVTASQCDLFISEAVKRTEKLVPESNLLIAAGKAALNFAKHQNEFELQSREFTAHSYLITGAEKLKSLVMDTADFLRNLNPDGPPQKC